MAKKTGKSVCNLAELSRLEGVARSSVTRWDQAGAVAWTDDDPPRIDVGATRALVKEYKSPTSKTDGKLAALRAKNLGVEIRLRELRLRHREGELVEKAEVDFALCDLFTRLRQSFRHNIVQLVVLAHECDSTREALYKFDDHMADILYHTYAEFHVRLAVNTGEKPSEVRKMVRKAWESFAIPGWAEHLEKQIAENPKIEMMIREIEKLYMQDDSPSPLPAGPRGRKGRKAAEVFENDKKVSRHT